MTIDFDQARALAEETAKGCLQFLVQSDPKIWLREEHVEKPNCWLFMKSESLDFLPGCESSADCAFVVSKKGNVRVIADHHEDRPSLLKYLIEIDAYILGRSY
jgi:hypothetical protein